ERTGQSHVPSSTTPPPPRDQRERKYIYVLEGVLRGMAALERRLGVAGAGRLVNEFYKVARDVAFKHDALLDQPRLPEAPGTSGGEAMVRFVVGLPVASEDDAGRAIKL